MIRPFCAPSGEGARHNANMESKRLEQMLIAQIQSEFTAHQQYFGISIYFDRESLHRWAKLYRKQSMEEAGHATKIMSFLTDVGVEFDLPGLASAATHFESPLAAVQTGLASERRVTAEFRAMAKVALEDQDFTGFQFLQWFLEEQVEEESKANGLIDLLESGINPFEAEAHLDRFDS